MFRTKEKMFALERSIMFKKTRQDQNSVRFHDRRSGRQQIIQSLMVNSNTLLNLMNLHVVKQRPLRLHHQMFRSQRD